MLTVGESYRDMTFLVGFLVPCNAETPASKRKLEITSVAEPSCLVQLRDNMDHVSLEYFFPRSTLMIQNHKGVLDTFFIIVYYSHHQKGCHYLQLHTTSCNLTMQARHEIYGAKP